MSSPLSPPQRQPALPTTFTPPGSCLSDVYQFLTTGVATVSETESTDTRTFYELGARSSECFPPSGYLPWITNQVSSSAYYSPGVCPSGYLICRSDTIAVGTLTETRATCCPNGYACQNQSSLLWYQDHMCTLRSGDGSPMSYTATISGTVTTLTQTKPWGLNAYGISIRWMNTDLPTATTAPPPNPAQPPAQSSGLSSGAKAGIGIGVTVTVLLLIIIGWLLRNALQKRKQKSQKSEISDYEAVPIKAIPPPPELLELDSGHLHEMGASQ
ncbi:hypothetical protein PAAG_02256 [Paracoccidioides lutzii Pb01]|uniref:Uncharacterized protein n=1 Tax=Paracoccidioides lutzii (strain ATCC MYA-826 / Pb01) TaxID=502779 RepID=C1GVH9_PARBA|nr:hypothetical protein PAAG_02256 [Paracoccidioides lutzii Pb01]EEH40201.2 hypothetical protein PAAG_02256 [Paracoccidioides lutzii Pb01]